MFFVCDKFAKARCSKHFLTLPMSVRPCSDSSEAQISHKRAKICDTTESTCEPLVALQPNEAIEPNEANNVVESSKQETNEQSRIDDQSEEKKVSMDSVSEKLSESGCHSGQCETDNQSRDNRDDNECENIEKIHDGDVISDNTSEKDSPREFKFFCASYRPLNALKAEIDNKCIALAEKVFKTKFDLDHLRQSVCKDMTIFGLIALKKREPSHSDEIDKLLTCKFDLNTLISSFPLRGGFWCGLTTVESVSVKHNKYLCVLVRHAIVTVTDGKVVQIKCDNSAVPDLWSKRPEDFRKLNNYAASTMLNCSFDGMTKYLHHVEKISETPDLFEVDIMTYVYGNANDESENDSENEPE